MIGIIVVCQWDMSLRIAPKLISNLINYPLSLITGGFAGRGRLIEPLARQNDALILYLLLDADVISTYVGIGMGVGTIAEMAFWRSELSQSCQNSNEIFPARNDVDSPVSMGIIRNFRTAFVLIFVSNNLGDWFFGFAIIKGLLFFLWWL